MRLALLPPVSSRNSPVSPPGAITGVIDRLEKAGDAVREADANDRRRVIIQPIAGRAREVNQMFESTSHSITAEVITRYDEPERTLILDFLTRVTSSLLQKVRRPARGKIRR